MRYEEFVFCFIAKLASDEDVSVLIRAISENRFEVNGTHRYAVSTGIHRRQSMDEGNAPESYLSYQQSDMTSSPPRISEIRQESRLYKIMKTAFMLTIWLFIVSSVFYATHIAVKAVCTCDKTV